MNNRMRSIIYAYLGILIPLNFVVKFTPLEVFASVVLVFGFIIGLIPSLAYVNLLSSGFP